MSDLPNLANLDYVDRINRAVDYVTRNLAQPLRLEDVARAACFSSYHFQRSSSRSSTPTSSCEQANQR